MVMQLRMKPEEDQMLQELAKELGVSKNQTVALLVREAWEARVSRSFTFSMLEELSVQRKRLLDQLAQ